MGQTGEHRVEKKQREVKLIFREHSLAEELAGVMLNAEKLYGYPCAKMEERVYEDLYFDTPSYARHHSGVILRYRTENSGNGCWQQKCCLESAGNERVYHTRTSHSDASSPPLDWLSPGESIVPVLSVRVRRRGITVRTLSGLVHVVVDAADYSHPDGKSVGERVEVEVSADPACTSVDTIVEHLRFAFGLIPARHSKLACGLRFLHGSSYDGVNRKKVILDMDPGVDDAIALLFALAAPELQVMCVTTVAGNVGIEQTTRNACCIVDKAQSLFRFPYQVEVVQGLEPPGGIPDAADVHGFDGLGGASDTSRHIKPVKEMAHKRIADLLWNYPDEITVIATGPLTNLARCAEEYPLALAKAREIICMGGVFFNAGNRSAAAEFNIHRDPEAAAKVVDFSRRRKAPGREPIVPLTFIGLDVTHQVRLLRNDLPDGNAVSNFVRRISNRYMEFYEQNEGLPGCYLHDPLTIAYAIDPSICEVEPFHVEIETDGHFTSGATIADMRPTRIYADEERRVTNVAVTVQAAKAKRLVMDRLQMESSRLQTVVGKAP